MTKRRRIRSARPTLTAWGSAYATTQYGHRLMMNGFFVKMLIQDVVEYQFIQIQYG